MPANEFIFPVKVYIEDTDYGGVVYHAKYLNFYERARTEWITALGMGYEWQLAQKIYFVVRAITIDYLKPVRLGDTVEVVTRLGQLKPSSGIFQQHLRSAAAPDTILNTAEVRIVCVNDKFRPQNLPPCQLHEIITGDKT
jgi:acyl-CoA thioester hydrolase